jgi:hypothetical protein
MPDDRAILGYSPKPRRRLTPTGADVYIALFTIIAAVAGLIGAGLVVCHTLMWFRPAWFGEREGPPFWIFAIWLAIDAAVFALTFFAIKLARRRAVRRDNTPMQRTGTAVTLNEVPHAFERGPGR